MASTKKSRPTENAPRNPHPPNDRDHLETARENARPTRWPTLARFHRSRVCGNRPRTALAISKNDYCDTHIHTDRLNNGTLYAPRCEEALFALKAKNGLASLLIERYMRQEAASYLQQAVCEKKNSEKSRPTQNTPLNPQQPGDRDHLETARENPRPTR